MFPNENHLDFHTIFIDRWLKKKGREAERGWLTTRDDGSLSKKKEKNLKKKLSFFKFWVRINCKIFKFGKKNVIYFNFFNKL